MCVVKIAETQNNLLVSLPGGLTITERHPIMVNGKWSLPCEISSERVSNTSNYVYCFVLDKCHVALVNGIQCVTWGHQIKD